MIFFKVLLFVELYFIICCNGCFPTPSKEPPVILCDPNPCSLTGALITVTSGMADSNCIYSATAACNPMNATIQYNGGGPLLPSPQPLICDSATSQYTYTDGAGVQQQLTSIQCICDPNPCTQITAPGLVYSPDTVDEECVYRAEIQCTTPGMMTIEITHSMGVDYYGPTQELTCDNTVLQQTFPFGAPSAVTGLACVT